MCVVIVVMKKNVCNGLHDCERMNAMMCVVIDVCCDCCDEEECVQWFA
jgi:hypothetical protein